MTETNFDTKLQQERTTYAEMIDFCADSLILNNCIVETLAANNIYFDDYCGSCYDEDSDEYNEIYQYFIIDSSAAERFAEYTNEYIIYNDDIDMYLLCVMHCGTPWSGCPANWKNVDDMEV